MTPRALLGCARDFLALSQEGHWRAAVSRAYYACFHDAIHLFRSLRFRVPVDGSAHRYLSDRLLNAGIANWELAGRQLERLRDARTDADYDLTVSFGQLWAERMMDSADTVFALLDQLRSDPSLLTAVATIRAYEIGRGQVTYHGP